MATVVNTPASGDGSGGSNAVLTVVLVLIVLFVFMYFGLPLLRRASTPTQVNVPDKVDVNVNGPQPQ